MFIKSAYFLYESYALYQYIILISQKYIKITYYIDNKLRCESIRNQQTYANLEPIKKKEKFFLITPSLK